MRRAEGPMCHQRLPRFQQTDNAVDLRDLQRLFERQRWKYCGEPFGQHRFAGSGRANQKNVMTAGGRNLQRAFHRFLAFDLGKIHFVIALARKNFRDVYNRRRDIDFAFEKRAGFPQVLNRDHLKAGNDRGFRRILRRDKNSPLPILSGA